MAYSNAAIFVSEFITTMFAIYMAESVVATELLPETKGRSMGWGFVSLGYGFAFGFGVVILGFISAIMNPAVALALLILGQINGAQFAAAVGGESLGAFCGAVLVWLHFLPHFKTSPTHYFTTSDNALLNDGTISQRDLEIASYNVEPKDVEARRRGLKDIGYAYQDIRYYLKDNFTLHAPVKDAPLAKVTIVPDDESAKNQKNENNLHRRSAQDGDGNYSLPNSPTQSSIKSFSSSVSSSTRTSAVGADTTQGYRKTADSSTRQQQHAGHAVVDPNEQRQQQLNKLYEAAVIADQNVKLSIFCTRPAIYSPALNFLCEFLCTTALIYGLLLISARQELLYGPERSLYYAEEGIWIGFFIFLCVLGLGGPTGIAANPARDFAPRVAHSLLPIPGKGGSDFYYSWIPVVAPMIGGCAAAGLYSATQLLNNSKVPAEAIFPATPN